MAAGDPTGENLCVGTTNGNTLPENPNFEEREITFVTPIELTEGVKYAIVINAASRTGAAEVHWAARADNPYANGSRYVSADSGGSWTISATVDNWFKTKANGIVKDDGSLVATGDVFTFGATWNAQTFIASSTYTISSVILELQKLISGGGEPGIVTVSIRATAAVPEQAINPAPDNSADNIVTLDQTTISWEDGGNAETYDVYYGDNAAEVAAADNTDTTGIFLGNQAETSFTIDGITLGSPFDYLIIRYWRIDSVNVTGITTGVAWLFACIAFAPPLPTGVTLGGDGEPTGTPTGENNMMTVRRLVVAANDKIWYEDL